MIEDIKKIKIYGGIGQLLIVFSIFIFPILKFLFKFISDIFGYNLLIYNLIGQKLLFLIFIIGNILVIYAVKILTDVICQKSVFKKFLISYLAFILSLIIALILLFVFLVLGLGSALSDQVLYGMNKILTTMLFLSFIIFLISFYFYRRSLLIIFQLTNQNLFKIAGNLYLLGGVFLFITIIGELLLIELDKDVSLNKFLYLTSFSGLFLILLGLFLPVFGFFRIKEVYNPNLS